MEPTDPPDPITDPLRSLRWHWGSAYVITNPRPGIWLAHRRDTYDTLRAETPPALRDAIRADYIRRRVPRDVGRNRTLAPRTARWRPV
jgi:hypothetical protein